MSETAKIIKITKDTKFEDLKNILKTNINADNRRFCFEYDNGDKIIFDAGITSRNQIYGMFTGGAYGIATPFFVGETRFVIGEILDYSKNADAIRKDFAAYDANHAFTKWFNRKCED